MSEIPVHFRPRKLADWINPTGARKVHSLVDKVYKRKNLEMAWEKVKPKLCAETDLTRSVGFEFRLRHFHSVLF